MYDKTLNQTIDDNGTEQVQQGSPGWFQGTGNELSRAATNIGVTFERVSSYAGQSALNVTAGLAASQGQPAYAEKLHAMAPIDETQLAKYEKPDALNSGKAAILLGDLFQQAPTIAAAFINPAAGFTAGAAAGFSEGTAQAQDMGITGPAAVQYAGLNALESGIGGALPGIGGIGESALIKYGSRFVVGGAVNTATSEAGTFSRAAVLDSYGFHDQANQLRQWDTQAALTQFVLGGLFNLGGGHVRDRGDFETSPGVRETIAPTEPQAVAAVPESAPPAPAPELPARQPELRGAPLTRQEMKQAKSDVANAERHMQRIETERAAILAEPAKGSGKQLAAQRQAKQERLQALEQQRAMTEQMRSNAIQRMEDHRAYHVSRLAAEHGDAAVHNAVHDNYVTEAAPGLAADAHTEAAHVKAMDATAEAVHTGRAVDVSEHFADDHTFIVHGDIDAGTKERQTFGEAGVAKTDAIVNASKEQGTPLPAAEPQPGQIDANIEQPFDVLRAQVMALGETHPELAEALAPHIDAVQAEHALAHQEADQYNVAAACAISYGA